MRGLDQRSGALFSDVDLEARVRADHPLRSIRQLTDEALAALTGSFSALFASRMGRPSIPPGMLLRAMLLQAFDSIRSERQRMERREFDLSFRRFVGLGIDDQACNHSSFARNRDRLLAGEIAAQFLAAVLAQPRVKRLLSSDHVSVDGTLIEAWASMKSFKPKDQDGTDQGEDPPPLRSTGTAMTRWTRSAALDRLSFRLTDRFEAKSVSIAATKSSSSPAVGRLLRRFRAQPMILGWASLTAGRQFDIPHVGGGRSSDCDKRYRQRSTSSTTC